MVNLGYFSLLALPHPAGLRWCGNTEPDCAAHHYWLKNVIFAGKFQLCGKIALFGN